MINAYVFDSRDWHKELEFQVLPRIGETIHADGRTFVVEDVIHRFNGTKSNGIGIKVDWI